MELAYGKYAVLATGAAIGLALFFFCSGFTIWRNEWISTSFVDYYSRRIRRIYPTVFAVALCSSAIHLQNYDMFDIIIKGGGWFIGCIMVQYAAYYIIQKYLNSKIHYILFAYVSVMIVIALIINPDDINYYFNGASNIYPRFMYFSFMLLGGVCRKYYEAIRDCKINKYVLIALSIILPIAFYAILYVLDKMGLSVRISITAIIPLLNLPLIWMIAFSKSSVNYLLENRKWIRVIVKTIAVLSLEIYLCQNWCITSRFNNLFPLNLILIFVVILIVSYGVHILSNLFTVIFSREKFDIKRVVSLW